jgi:hypothetical protein
MELLIAMNLPFPSPWKRLPELQEEHRPMRSHQSLGRFAYEIRQIILN